MVLDALLCDDGLSVAKTNRWKPVRLDEKMTVSSHAPYHLRFRNLLHLLATIFLIRVEIFAQPFQLTRSSCPSTSASPGVSLLPPIPWWFFPVGKGSILDTTACRMQDIEKRIQNTGRRCRNQNERSI